MKKLIITIIILLFTVAGGYYYFNCQKADKAMQISPPKAKEKTLPKQNVPQANKTIQKNIKQTSEQESNQNEFLVYQDADITFKYPKKIISTKPQDNFEIKEGAKWKVMRKGDIIYILAPFEDKNKISDYTSFMIKIFNNAWDAQKEFNKIVPLYKENHNVPVPQWGNKMYSMTSAGYYVGILSKVGIDMGIVDDVYFLVPGGLSVHAQSKKPNEEHFVVYARSDIYADYIKNILLPSIKNR